jgi:hypothetical protein
LKILQKNAEQTFYYSKEDGKRTKKEEAVISLFAISFGPYFQSTLCQFSGTITGPTFTEKIPLTKVTKCSPKALLNMKQIRADHVCSFDTP